MGEISVQKALSLNEIASRTIGFACAGVIGVFVEKYIRCEALASKLIMFYCQDREKTPPPVLQLQQIQAALKWYEIQVMDESELKYVFSGGRGKRNQKSARQLRNGYLHSLSPDDRTEIEMKIDELSIHMDKFINIFRKFYNDKI